jgi:hypothetical protein
VKDFERPKTDPSQDAPQHVAPRGRAHSEGRDASHVGAEIVSHSKPEADVLSTPELSHPVNAAPLADLLGQLQQSHGNVYVQRVVSDMSQAKSGAESGPTSRGQSLDAGVRSEMESAFAENFGDVRVHTGGAAEMMNEELGARAVTRGRDIYFGKGEYEPATREGKELIAHELTHVVQQGERSADHQAALIGQAGDTHEQEADLAAAAVLAGQRPAIVKRSGAPAYQRQSPAPHGGRRPRFVNPHPHHVYLDSSDAGFGWLAERSTVSYRFDLASSRHYTLRVTLPEGMTYAIHRGYGRTHVVEPAEFPLPSAERFVTVEVPRRERERPTIRMTFYFENVEFRIHFHFYRQAETR